MNRSQRCQQPFALLYREPVPDAVSNPADPFDASDSGCQFRAEQSGISGLVGDPPNGRQVQIDRCRRVVFLFEIDPVSEYHGAIEREGRFRAVPLHEIGDGVVIAPLTAPRREAVQDCRFRLFEVGECQARFGDRLFFLDFGMGGGLLDRR